MQSCTLPGRGVSDPVHTPTLNTPTPKFSPTPTVTPSPTPSPTPNPKLRITLAEQAFFIGDFDTALKEAQNALNASSDSDIQAAAMVLSGQVYYRMGNYSLALQTLTETLSRYPSSNQAAKANYLLALTQKENGDSLSAVKYFTNYLQIKPGVIDSYVYEQIGDCYSAAGDTAKAATAYQASLDAPRTGITTWTQIKYAQASAASGDYTNAIKQYLSVYQSNASDFYKARANFLLGQTYLKMGMSEQAYTRFQDSLSKFPRQNDTYQGLVVLVKAGIPVNEFWRGMVDYYAGQYGVAIDAFNRYIKQTPDHDGTALYYIAQSLRAQDFSEQAIAQWNTFIAKHPANKLWVTAWEDIAYTQWGNLRRLDAAIDTYQRFITQNPTHPETPRMIFTMAQLLERNNRLPEAIAAWERIINDFPAYKEARRGLFMAGITHYRMGNYSQAKTNFQRNLILTSDPYEQSTALLWIGKSQAAQNDIVSARTSWEQAALKDPTGYYSERAKELLAGKAPFSSNTAYNLGYDLNVERLLAESWLRSTFSLPASENLSGLGNLGEDARIKRANAFLELGLETDAKYEIESIRQELKADPASTYRLISFMVENNLYRSGILASRQVLDAANLDDQATLRAPAFFTHLRFGTYYKNLVLPAAQAESLHPLLLFAVIRQESFFDKDAVSGSGARGLMQIMPATGKEIAGQMGFGSNFSDNDLFRPVVNIKMGANYLARWKKYFNGDVYAALASYNGGPGNTIAWKEIAPNDPDLFLEVIRAEETRNYIRYIYEFFQIFRLIYEQIP